MITVTWLLSTVVPLGELGDNATVYNASAIVATVSVLTVVLLCAVAAYVALRTVARHRAARTHRQPTTLRYGTHKVKVTFVIINFSAQPHKSRHLRRTQLFHDFQGDNHGERLVFLQNVGKCVVRYRI